jgi:glycosyltransferase involved in cell wall biosynthesis
VPGRRGRPRAPVTTPGRGAPVVSVLLPVRDDAEYLDQAVASILAQTVRDLEVVAVDDGSTDGSAERLDAWASRDGRVRVLRQAPAGIVAALERARAAASGPYLARMDADDVAHEQRFARQLELLQTDTTLAGCGCGVRYFPDEAVRAGARRYEAWLNRTVAPDAIEAALFVECPLAHPTFFLRAEAVDAVGGYRDAGWPEDYDLVLRLWRAGQRLGKVPDVLHRWRERPDRLSRTSAAYAREAFLSCKVHHLRCSLLTNDRACVVWGSGPIGKAFSKALRAAGTRVAAFVELDPRKLGQTIHGAPVVDPGQALGYRGPLHLAAVGQKGARERIRGVLRAGGFREVSDFVAVA